LAFDDRQLRNGRGRGQVSRFLKFCFSYLWVDEARQFKCCADWYI